MTVDGPSPYRTPRAEIELVHGDAFDTPWEDATVVFANSTCFSDEVGALTVERATEITNPLLPFPTFADDGSHGILRKPLARRRVCGHLHATAAERAV